MNTRFKRTVAAGAIAAAIWCLCGYLVWPPEKARPGGPLSALAPTNQPRAESPANPRQASPQRPGFTRMQDASVQSEYRERLYRPKKPPYRPVYQVKKVPAESAERAMVQLANFVNQAIRFAKDEQGVPKSFQLSATSYTVKLEDCGICGNMLLLDGDWGRIISFGASEFEFFRDDRFERDRFQAGSTYDGDLDRMKLIEALRREPNYATSESATKMILEALVRLGADPGKLASFKVVSYQEPADISKQSFLPIFTVFLLPPGEKDWKEYAAWGAVAGCIPPKGAISSLNCSSKLPIPLKCLINLTNQ